MVTTKGGFIIGEGKIVLVAQYDVSVIWAVKSRLQGRRWNPDNKTWTAPVTPENIETAIAIAEELDLEINAEKMRTGLDHTTSYVVPCDDHCDEFGEMI